MEDGPKTELKCPAEDEGCFDKSLGPKRSTNEEEEDDDDEPEPLVTFFVNSICKNANEEER